jgi:FkbM family methyltransferase
MSGMKISQELLGFEVRTRGKRWRLFLGKQMRQLLPAFRLNRHLAWLFGRSIKVSVMGRTLYLDLRDEAVSSSLYSEGIWEPEETAFVEKTLRPGMVFVDIGAHIGYFALMASGIVGNSGKVFAFEPDPGNFSLLERNVNTNHCQNVVVEQKAVTASSDKLLLYRSPNNWGDHRAYKPQYETGRDGRERRSAISVQATSLDAYFEQNPTRIDFVKMDIQGSEYAAFAGMHRVLEQNPDIVVLTEFWPKGLREAGVRPEVFLDAARESGFGFYRLDRAGPCEVSVAGVLEQVSGGAYTSLIFSRKKLFGWETRK